MVRLVDLSQPFGDKCPLWPYFQDISIERIHYHAKSGVLTQKITTTMHTTTHADSPAHVFEGGAYTDQIPLDKYYGTGVVIDVGNLGKWGNITGDILENATPRVERDDIVIIHTHMHAQYADTKAYFAYSPGLVKSAGEWLIERGVKCVGVDQQALDHPLSTAIGPHGLGPILPAVNEEYERERGRKVIEDYPDWEPCHNMLLKAGIMGYENVGGDIDEVLGMRVKLAGFPIRWEKGDGSIVRLVAIIE